MTFRTPTPGSFGAFRLMMALAAPWAAATIARAQADSGPQLVSKTGGGSTWGSIAELEAAVKKGNPKAKAQLGDMMLRGDDPKADLNRALTLLEEAARAGEAQPAFRLGMTLVEGEIVAADAVRGVAYLRAAAVGGVDEAFRNVGVAYSTGKGVKRDYAEALAWLILAEKHHTADTVGQDLRKHLTRLRRPEAIAAGEKRAPELERELAATTVAKSLPVPGPFTLKTSASGAIGASPR